MDNKRLEQIRIRKQKRTRKKLIILAVLLVILVLIIYLIINVINAVTKTIKSAIPTPDPSPVSIVSPDGTPIDSISDSETQEKDYSASLLPSPSENNDIMSLIESSATDKKVCYLTFDDGPNNTVTPQILDVLRRYNIKATFFQVGSLIEANEDISRRVYDEGHLIANHSYDHTYSKIYASKDSFMEEFNKTAELIKNITGDDYFPVIRFPGGSHNTGTYGEAKQEYKKSLAENGYYFCDWNALSGDAESTFQTTKQLLQTVKSTIGKQNKVVLLMHDASNKKQTVEALPEIIKYLISQGYTFATLNNILF